MNLFNGQLLQLTEAWNQVLSAIIPASLAIQMTRLIASHVQRELERDNFYKKTNSLAKRLAWNSVTWVTLGTHKLRKCACLAILAVRLVDKGDRKRTAGCATLAPWVILTCGLTRPNVLLRILAVLKALMSTPGTDVRPAWTTVLSAIPPLIASDATLNRQLLSCRMRGAWVGAKWARLPSTITILGSVSIVKNPVPLARRVILVFAWLAQMVKSSFFLEVSVCQIAQRVQLETWIHRSVLAVDKDAKSVTSKTIRFACVVTLALLSTKSNAWLSAHKTSRNLMMALSVKWEFIHLTAALCLSLS